MDSWQEVLANVDALDGVVFDPALVEHLHARGRQVSARSLNCYVPSFKAYATSEIEGCGKNAWPAISITGSDCELACDHCRAKILEPMIPARTPTELWQTVVEQIAAGAHGMLLTGGSNRRDEIQYDSFYPTIRKIKDSYPEFRIAMHTALATREAAMAMDSAGVDVAMMDMIGAQDTVTQVYHLRRKVADFERSLENLCATRMRVVPHIVLGLHYGRMLGEWAALETIARHCPHALVLVVVMPMYSPVSRPFAIPEPRAVGRFFADAREMFADIPILLGCARPAGLSKSAIDAYAVMAGLDGIAHPADGMVELATTLGRPTSVSPSCCSIAVGNEVLGACRDGAVLDLCKAREFERRGRRIAHRLRGIPVVAA